VTPRGDAKTPRSDSPDIRRKQPVTFLLQSINKKPQNLHQTGFFQVLQNKESTAEFEKFISHNNCDVDLAFFKEIWEFFAHDYESMALMKQDAITMAMKFLGIAMFDEQRTAVILSHSSREVISSQDLDSIETTLRGEGIFDKNVFTPIYEIVLLTLTNQFVIWSTTK